MVLLIYNQNLYRFVFIIYTSLFFLFFFVVFVCKMFILSSLSIFQSQGNFLSDFIFVVENYSSGENCRHRRSFPQYRKALNKRPVRISAPLE